MAPRIGKLELAAAKFNGELSEVLRAVRSLKSRDAVGEDSAITAEDRACKTFDMMFEFGHLLKG